MIRAVAFDLDGTLVYHKKEYIFYLGCETLSRLGFHPDEKFAYEFWFASNRDEFIERRLGINYMDFWKIFWQLDTPEARIANTEVHEDVVVLKYLYEMDIELGIVSGALTKVAEPEIAKVKEKAGKIEFKSIVTNNPAARIKQKPDPDTILKSLNEFGVKIEEFIYVGNSMEDFQAAKAAHARSIIVLREGTDLSHCKYPVKTINSLYELADII